MTNRNKLHKRKKSYKDVDTSLPFT